MTATDEEQAETVEGAVAGRELEQHRQPEGRVSLGAGGIMSITRDQEWWNAAQLAGLKQLGIDKAPAPETAVFFHTCQRTGLDPFARQIFLIKRRQWDPDARQMVDKWTIQTGIEGFRVVRMRAERETHCLTEFEDTVWFDAEGNEHTAWLWEDRIPVACRVVLVKIDLATGLRLRFSSVLRMAAYMATREKDGQRVPTGRWVADPDHQLEKCCEAAATRRAYPQDMSGLYIVEEMDRAQQPEEPQRPRPARAQPQRPQEAATVAGAVEPEAQTVSGATGEAEGTHQAGDPDEGTHTPLPGATGWQPAGGAEQPQEPRPFDPGSFDRGKAQRAMRAVLGHADPSMNRKADDDLRLRLTGVLAAEPDQPPLWLASSTELSDEQMHRVCELLHWLQRQHPDPATLRSALEGVVQSAEARWPDENGDSPEPGE